jgi:hypothetical protein
LFPEAVDSGTTIPGSEDGGKLFVPDFCRALPSGLDPGYRVALPQPSRSPSQVSSIPPGSQGHRVVGESICRRSADGGGAGPTACQDGRASGQVPCRPDSDRREPTPPQAREHETIQPPQRELLQGWRVREPSTIPGREVEPSRLLFLLETTPRPIIPCLRRSWPLAPLAHTAGRGQLNTPA